MVRRLDKGVFIDQQSAVKGNIDFMDAVQKGNEEVIHVLSSSCQGLIRNYWNQNAHELALNEKPPNIVNALGAVSQNTKRIFQI